MAPVVLADIESGRAKLEAHEIRRFAKLHSRQRRTPPRQRLQISGIPTRRPTNTPFLFRLRKTTPMIRFNSYAKVNKIEDRIEQADQGDAVLRRPKGFLEGEINDRSYSKQH